MTRDSVVAAATRCTGRSPTATSFEGEAIGADTPATTGEFVFNTALSGYQEIVTDPSYADR